MTKQMDKQEVIEKQIECPDCQIKRMQLLSIITSSNSSQLNLLCLDCGCLSILLIGEGMTTPKPKTINKEVSYI